MEENENLVKKAAQRSRFNFEDFLFHLLEYKKEFGNLRVKRKYVCQDGYKLGRKVERIRVGAIKLTAFKKEQLNNVNFIWDAKTFNFNEFYTHLLEYKKEFGNLEIKQKYVCQDGYKLGLRVSEIRVGAIKLTAFQKEQLNNINFIWSAKDFNFDEFYTHLLEYKQEFGNLNVPQKYVCKDGYKLGKKINQIRGGRIKLTKRKKEQLDVIGFVWNATIQLRLNKFNFKLFYNYLHKYKQKFGNCFVEYDYVVNNYELGFYVRNIRNKRIILTDNQIEQLNSLGFVFNTQSYYKDKPEVSLIERMQNGDISARNGCIQNYMPLVYKIVEKYKGLTNYSDLVGIAYDGLNHALDNSHAHNESEQKAYIIKTVRWKIIKYLTKIINVKSLSDKVNNTGYSTIEETVADDTYRPDIQVENKEYQLQLLENAKQILTKDEFKLLCLHFGFNKNLIAYSTEQLAQKYNTTPEKVSIAIDRIIINLKQHLSSDEWRL